MAFNTIPSSIIAVGKAITNTLMSFYIKDSLDDLDSRMTVVEAAQGKVIPFDEIVYNASSFSSGGTATGLAYWRSPSGFTMTDAKLYIFTKGSLTGNLELDVQVSSSSDFTSSVSIFTTKPKIVYSTASDYDESANVVFDLTNKVISEGEYLRLDLTALPSGGAVTKFGFYVIGE